MNLRIIRKGILILRLFCLLVVVGAAVVLFSSLIIHLTGLKYPNNLLNKLNFLQWKNWLIVGFAVILEEFVFRGMLSLSDRGIVGSSIAVTFFIVASWFIRSGINIEQNIILHGIAVVLCFFISFVVGYLVSKYAVGFIKHFILVRYNLYFWATCLAFSLYHISNYSSQSDFFVVYIILVIPQFFVGAMLGIIRIKHGIRASIVVHFLYDAWFFMVGIQAQLHVRVLVVLIGIILVGCFVFGLMQWKLFRGVINDLRNPGGATNLSRLAGSSVSGGY